MASINEVLLAIEGQKSPFVHILEGVAGGVSTAQNQALENARVLIALEQQRQEMAQQAQLAKEVAAGTESKTQSELRNLTPGSPVHPAQKLQVEYSQDERGRYSRKFKTVEPKEVTYQSKEYYDPKTKKTYIGRFNPVTGVTETSPNDPEAAPSAISNPSYQFIGMQNGQPVFLNPKTTETKTGSLPGKGPLVPTTQTEGQANAKLYAQRVEEADKQINDLATQVDLSSLSAGIQGKLPNIAKSEDVQLFEQSKRNFLNAVLRRESGAVISPTEFAEGNRQYFPVTGDSEKVKRQKALNRRTAIEGLNNAAGGASYADGGAPKKVGRFEVTVKED